MATLTTQTITRAGVDPSLSAAAGGGDSFTPGDDVFLHVNNGGGGSITVTIVGQGTILPNMNVPSVVVSVTNGQDRMIGPFPHTLFADPTDGLADITYSGVTSVTVGAFRLQRP